MTFTYEQVSKIMENSKFEIESNPKYSMFYKRDLQNYWESRINKANTFALYISGDDLNNIDFGKLNANIDTWEAIIATSNFIQIDSTGIIINSTYIAGSSEQIKAELISKSRYYYVFFFGENGITHYINGVSYEDKNFFYSQEDRMKYREKKDISKLNEVISAYSDSFVSQQVNYMCFFADNSTLRQINGGSRLISKNILKNKPEHYMRDQLRQYLTDNMQYTFLIEPELGQSKRELDIYFEVSGSLYFIEIKWLGTSINDDGTGLSTSYSEARAKEGVTQSLEYIEELVNTQGVTLRHGYLAIFDARDTKSTLDFDNYSFVRAELKTYLALFNVLPIINLEKRHSA